MSQEERHYYVYIVASRTHVLYIGVTNNLKRRVEQHRTHYLPGFTDSYQCERLVWYESYRYINRALDREKQLKRWSREKKIWIIERMNPTWADLSDAWEE